MPALGPLESSAQAGMCDLERKPANLNFTLKDVNGRDVTLSASKGKVILLDFWATWCAPCKIMIPGFVELYEKYQSRGFVVLGVSVDDPIAKLKPFVENLMVSYPVLVGMGRDDLQEAFGPPPGFPTSFLIDRSGNICKERTGFVPKEESEREIKALL